MPHEYKLTRRVEFPDTDMAGIVYFANFFKFMESTEHAFFRSQGLTVHSNRGEPTTGWARVHASCDYMRPAHFEDLLEVHLVVREKTQKTLRYSFEFRVIDEGPSDGGNKPGPVIARGELVVAHVNKSSSDGVLRGAEIPDEVVGAIQVAPAGS
jgi:acyl-CoA thioester hydrolase